MCELLVFIEDRHIDGDPEQEKLQWKSGQVVAIKPDGWKWGSAELIAPFRVVKLQNVPEENCGKYLGRLYNTDDLIAGVPKPREDAQRRYVINVEGVNSIKDTLESGIVAVTAKITALDAITIDKALVK